jgi:TIR domain
MTTIFLSHAREDVACADQLRQGLEQAGYRVWREPDYPMQGDVSYPYVIENAILGSAAVVVLWSRSAASFAWVKRHMLIAQRFFKPRVPVRLDETDLPSTLLVESLTVEESSSDVVGHLLPLLPAPDSSDPLLALAEQAAHQYMRERKEAIDRAATMLQKGEQREEVLAMLEYLARNDVMNGVREKAQGVLAAATQQQPASTHAAANRPRDARHQFDVRCQQGHITRFDRRDACAQKKKIARELNGDTEVMRGLDELILTCPACGVKMAVDVDCEGY